jgi:hypothetical protein
VGVGEYAKGRFYDVGNHAGERHEKAYLEVGEVEVRPDQGPGGLTHAADKLIEKLDQEKDEREGAKG